MPKKLTIKDLQARVSESHPGLTVISYKNSREPVDLLCVKHGKVTVKTAQGLLNGSGCPNCGYETARQNLRPESAPQFTTATARAAARRSHEKVRERKAALAQAAEQLVAGMANPEERAQALQAFESAYIKPVTLERTDRSPAQKPRPLTKKDLLLSSIADRRLNTEVDNNPPAPLTKRQQLLELKRLERERLELEILAKLEASTA